MHPDDPARPAVLKRLQWDRPWREDSEDTHEICAEWGLGRMRTMKILQHQHADRIDRDSRAARFEARRRLRKRWVAVRTRRAVLRTTAAAAPLGGSGWLRKWLPWSPAHSGRYGRDAVGPGQSGPQIGLRFTRLTSLELRTIEGHFVGDTWKD